MEISASRTWRSTHRAAQQRGCAQRTCLRVVSFHGEPGPAARKPPASASQQQQQQQQPHNGNGIHGTNGHHHSHRQQRVAEPLTLERIPSLPPAVLAASLLEHAKHRSLDSAFGATTTTATATGSNATGSTTTSGTTAAAAVAGADPALLAAVARHVMAGGGGGGGGGGLAEYEGPALVDLISAFSAAGPAADAAAAGASAGRSPHRDFMALCCAELTAGKLDDLAPADISRLVGACAAAELAPTDLLAAACSRASELLPQFAPADLVSLLAALATLGHRAPALFADAADVVAAALQLPQGHGSALEPAQAAAAVWALAAEALYYRPLFDAAGSVLMDRGLGGLDGNTLARVAWAYATIRSADEAHRGVWDRDLFDGIASTCVSRAGPALASTFPPRALVTLLWSFASIPHFDQPLFEALSNALVPRLGAVSAADLVAVAWSVMRVGHRHAGLMGALGPAALSAAAAGQLDGDDLTTIGLAFPAAHAYSEPFFKYLVTEAQARPAFFGQVALLDIIRLISRVQDRDPGFYKPALEVLLDKVHEAYLDAPLEKSGCMNPFRFG
ncbi:hypothetical protein HYH02_002675 [Chlamydomonas schloesseri]|uniref:Uncharacterized protein n=1 Tax=Chlamydomonas schloesseri TaxID=2026947 RepID=A0A835WS29_9CHLO|nr:hypothetical protein HYH02_002675 [Chlamydomonas schloesseri]|eukprot:KAG2452432.1 hypothetical protein HYH02_002675 [Chlamydomonas schloesseri]